jgi:hypothetical protein
VIKSKVGDRRDKRGGWAPGRYLCTCSQPSHVGAKRFTGDKRATICADCAYAKPDPIADFDAVKARLAEVERQNADLQAANNRLLERERTAKNTVVLKIQLDAAKALEDIVSVQERLMELEAYREAAIYDEFIYAVAVPGPHLGGWDHSKHAYPVKAHTANI